MRLLDQFISEPRECSYLKTETASLEYRVMVDVDAAQWELLLERGWRRFGVAYFRPKCHACSECVPLRVVVDEFSASRNQRRIASKGASIRLEIGTPRIDDERLELYQAWHDMQSDARGWGGDVMTAERYFHEFAFPHPSVREFAYYDADRLIAVGIVDETPSALSAVYTYHHPEYRSHSLGTLSILRQVEVARRAKKTWLYLGYRVLGCVSSQYKARFRPHEVLKGWPGGDEPATWVADSDATEPA